MWKECISTLPVLLVTHDGQSLNSSQAHITPLSCCVTMDKSPARLSLFLLVLKKWNKTYLHAERIMCTKGLALFTSLSAH